ncbi:MAG: hypothetical protein HYY50_00445 [Candidatus Kerfeldbacteria bacterium]|nr:hypothetical protein [Candidatus Kerfeldbacteria bacterium]
MSNILTMRELKASIEEVKGQIRGLDLRVQGVELEVKDLRQEMRHGFHDVDQKFSSLQSSVDRYFRKTESWHDEQVILKARHDRLSTPLIDRGILTKEETLL